MKKETQNTNPLWDFIKLPLAFFGGYIALCILVMVTMGTSVGEVLLGTLLGVFLIFAFGRL